MNPSADCVIFLREDNPHLKRSKKKTTALVISPFVMEVYPTPEIESTDSLLNPKWSKNVTISARNVPNISNDFKD